MSLPKAARRVVELTNGVSAIAPGLLWLHDARALVAADVHLGYEDAIGAALPSWSTRDSIDAVCACAQSMGAREIVLLGDAIHSSRLSESAARAIRRGLDMLRQRAELTIVAGNHEGKSRGAAILGDTVEDAMRDGWLLLHGDRAPSLAALSLAKGAIIGHLHPSLPLGGRVTAPAFLAGGRIIVVPALTPYSNGLSVFSDDCMRALRPFNAGPAGDLQVVAAMTQRLYPFGSLSVLRKMLSSMK